MQLKTIDKPSAEQPVFLTRQELARRWKVSYRTLCDNQQLRPVKLGGVVRYSFEEVLAVEQGIARDAK